jgi:hypothetical protein
MEKNLMQNLRMRLNKEIFGVFTIFYFPFHVILWIIEVFFMDAFTLDFGFLNVNALVE